MSRIRYSVYTVKRSSWNWRIRRRRYNIIPVVSKFKTPCSIIKDKYMMKAQISSMRVAAQESQGGMRFKDNDLKIKIQAHRRTNNESKEFPRTQGSKFQEGLNAKTLNVKSISAMCDKCVLIDKHDMCVLISVAKPLKETVSSESNKNPRNFTRRLYERVSKTCSWWYPKVTPSGYKWRPKSGKDNVNLNLVEIFLFIVNSGCSKHMTENLKLLINFLEKFLGTVKFRNDQIAPILGYGDLVQGAVTIKRVYYVERLNHNLFSVDQLCDADLEVAFKKSTCFIRDLKGNDLLTEGILHQTSISQTPKQNGIVERRNRTLVEAARTMLSAAKVPQFFWAEAIATVCFTQNHGENLDKMKEKGDECIFVGYFTQSRAYIVFNKRTRVIMESIHVNFDELPQMASDQISSDPTPEYRIVTTSNELDLLFSLMFDELLNGSSKVVSKSSAISAADAPNQQVYAQNDQVADDEFINIFSTPVQDQGETSSCYVDSLNMHIFYQRYPSEHRWTKDHPLEQVIGNPLQSVRTRRQLESDAEMCMFVLTVSQTKPKNIKEAMADSAWIESMQEELHQFDRLDVWELVDRQLCTNVINLKWL
nr:hypothetical protein [Tanacetum cinerariifolium]